MPITPWIPAITTVTDGQEVSAEVVNPILAQYTQRTQYLYEAFNEFGDKAVLIAHNLPILQTVSPKADVGDFVCYSKLQSGEGLALTQVGFEANTTNQVLFTLANTTFPIGLVKSVSSDGKYADVYLSGLVQFETDIDSLTTGIIQSSECFPDEPFYPGPYYLSKDIAGKITAEPVGVAVYAGFAIDRRTFVLAPNVNEFSELFATYRYNVLDRPAGVPLLSGGTWTVTNVDRTKVGWIPVGSLTAPEAALAPVGAKFFYNLPSGTISQDTGITTYDRDEQGSLGRVLPFVDPDLTLLTINGISQAVNSPNELDGIYTVNNLGLWWFKDTDGEQPWASDITQDEPVSFDAGTDLISLNAHGFAVDDEMRFATIGTFPTTSTVTLNTNTSVWVVVPDTTNSFKVAATRGGAALHFTTAGSGMYVRQPYIWKAFRGTHRPRIVLQFIKFNPDVRNSFVTSLKKYNPNSEIISFWSASKSAESISGKGDLLVRVLMNFVAATSANSASAVSSLTYDEATGIITTGVTPIVSQLTQGPGIYITPVTNGGVAVPGSWNIAATSDVASGQVTSLEPDGAELLYLGLHSYINMTTPDVLPSSVIGKITLQPNIPTSAMSFVLWFVSSDSNAAGKNVDFNFSYAVSKPGNIIDGTMNTTQVTFTVPSPYLTKSVFRVVIPGMVIPTDQFAGGDCSVNFKLARLTSALNPLTSALGLVDMYWKIG